MSYILEALRKADAERERERGAVPNLHAQLIPLTAGRVDDEGARVPIGWWLGIGGAVLALGLLVWWWLAAVGGPGVAAAPTPTAATIATPVAVAPAPAAARSGEPAASTPSAAASASATVLASATTAGSTAAPAAAPASTQTSAIAAAPTAPPKPKPRPVAPPKATPRTAAPAPLEAPTPVRAGPPTATVAKPTAPSEATVPPLAELPEDVRRQVPAMAMGGSVHSPDPARRMIIVNGQVFVEGNTLAPELRLETINPKSAVFSIRGQRFQVPL